jgi:hypothetical protein
MLTIDSTAKGVRSRQLHDAIAFSIIVLQMIAVLCALAQPAYAYVDPGSGLLAVQIISTTFAGMIFLLRRRLRGFLKRITGHSGSKSGKVNKQ